MDVSVRSYEVRTRRALRKGHTWQLEGEVQRSEHDGREDPPATAACEESASASGNLLCARSGGVALSKIPVCSSEQAECGDQGGEDQNEDDVGAEGADHVDQAEESHPNLEEACGVKWSASLR